MRISIIIPTYKHLEDCLKPCCESIIKYTDLTDVEVIIVANGCGDDGTKEYVESLGEHFKLVWFDEGLGYTKATNEGVKVSTGEIIVLLNNDIVLLEQEKNTWLKMLLDPLKDNVGLTGNLKLWDHSVERRFCLFFCVAFPRHIWDKIGGLNEEWSPGGGEDIEFCIKVEQLGYKILQVPDDKPCEVKDGYNVNLFPLWHKAESTVMDDEHREKWIIHIADVRRRLEERYKLPTGWFYGGDVAEYRRLVEDVPLGGTICELGCFKGRSLCSVADIIKRKNLKVYVVDTFAGTVNEGQGNMDFLQEFKDNIKRFGINDLVRIYKGTTNEIVKEIPDKIFSLIFLDADHSYEAVKQDLENWEDKIMECGSFAGHDYGNHIGVSQAVNERYSNIRLNDEHFGIDSGIAIGSVWSKRL
jgi:glycosyltransferase involved in cell wall biosynthesis